MKELSDNEIVKQYLAGEEAACPLALVLFLAFIRPVEPPG